ncbi:TetR/AcrR family transcriptional regulator [Mycolicibacterium fluoranthenivorans]|jgi:AcrR family transcriptional regulator|uniref:TetR/AcrR family transcriptional regulator n=1 Tax=Mycolicibacterium fluoranthenivorans TaxID=258505 RepID=A0A7G8PN17_9MYCO|nr:MULTISPECIES: TetR family transcriptional regulator [Mycobacteriaceae]MCV7251244.1 TetR/AcrR family transcriptional regulator [Mycobacterium hackensackense]QNJ95733.1 TetR/AcrR family transcriptional regulator [Mycolicibacterium fluoranthenivorans]
MTASTDLPGYKQARRSQIVAAALAALKVHDYEQIQMRDVAVAADVALGTLYRYFSSKEHVYAAVLMEWAQPVFDDNARDDRPAERRVRQKVRDIITSFERWPAFFKVCMLLQNTTDANAQPLMQQFAETAQRTLAADFAALGHQESFDTAIMLWGIISTMLSGAIHNGYPIGDAYRVADAFIDLVAPRLPADQRSANTGG